MTIFTDQVGMVQCTMGSLLYVIFGRNKGREWVQTWKFP